MHADKYVKTYIEKKDLIKFLQLLQLSQGVLFVVRMIIIIITTKVHTFYKFEDIGKQPAQAHNDHELDDKLR